MFTKISFCIVAAALLLSGCKSKPGPPPKVTHVGIIEMVNPEQNYVLIRCEPLPAIRPGTELVAMGTGGQKSKLILTPERKGYYLTADIKDGQPAVNHQVIFEHETGATNAASPPIIPSAPSVAPSATPPVAPNAYLPMPFLPGVIPDGAASGPAMPIEPALPQSGPAPMSPPKGLGDLEPPVGGPPN